MRNRVTLPSMTRRKTDDDRKREKRPGEGGRKLPPELRKETEPIRIPKDIATEYRALLSIARVSSAEFFGELWPRIKDEATSAAHWLETRAGGEGEQ